MLLLEVYANEATAAQRRVYFQLWNNGLPYGEDPATGEAGGQPQISTDGAAFTDTGIGTLTHMGNGRYYADLTQAAVDTAGRSISTRFKSATTHEAEGWAVRTVSFDPNDAAALGLTNLNATVSSRASQTSLDTVDDLLDTEIPALTTNLATANSNISLIKTAADAILLDTGTDGVVLAAAAISAAKMAADMSTYAAEVEFIDAEAAETDRYVAGWFKNSSPVLSGITAPTLWVFDSGGNNLVGSEGSPETMTAIGSSGMFTYVETSDRIESGKIYFARVQATIDGSTRTWFKAVGRDSAA